MKNKEKYIRVATTYFKIVHEPDIHNESQSFKRLAKWDKSSIIDDKGKGFIKKIDRYDGFINYPSHSNYKTDVKGFYNEYHELSGSIKEGEFPYTQKLLKHIFGSFYEMGIDYLSLLWQKPTQLLPVLCVVSLTRNTGKTTFLNWFRMLFENNVAIIKKADFKSRFNDAWINKLIVAVDEAKFDKREETDYIKELSTSKTQQREKKGVDQKQENFFGKIILASNNIDDFIVVDKNEIRFWVLDINEINEYIQDFDEKLKQEIPYIKYFLENRKIEYPCSSRMWFKKEDIKTEALLRVVRNSYDIDEKELATVLYEYIELSEQETVKLALKDIKHFMQENRSFISNSAITKILKDKWNLLPTNNATTYKYYFKVNTGFENTIEINEMDKKGRVYTLHKEYFKSLI
ncbi:primase-helicase family protein [Psychroflexus aestuariivivens]|uniref:primase-helicase family protein n=1 Tax=Psychroflexus aestuariivivens TaxID=1795040 RepID=UPI000FD8DEBB|nr:primase-helicase family protein [Psychroflexus aestuariivivens]